MNKKIPIDPKDFMIDVLRKGFFSYNPLTWGWDFSTINPTKIGSGGSGSGFLGPYQIHPLNPSVVFSFHKSRCPIGYMYFYINLPQFAIQINHQMYKLIKFTNPMGSIIGSNPNKHPDTVIFGTTSIRSMVTADYRCGPTKRRPTATKEG